MCGVSAIGSYLGVMVGKQEQWLAWVVLWVLPRGYGELARTSGGAWLFWRPLGRFLCLILQFCLIAMTSGSSTLHLCRLPPFELLLKKYI